jgi:hypothetical protein
MAMPISPTLPEGPSFEPSPPLEPLFAPSQTQDTSGTAAIPNVVINITGQAPIVLSNTPITIGQFSDAVQLSLNSSNQMIHLDDLTSLIANGNVGVIQGDMGKSLAAIRQQITSLQEQEQALFTNQNNEIATENTAITNLNNAVSATQAQDQAEVNTMNQAIAQYNAGSITADQFNAVATAYNAYVAGRNAALQPAIDAYESATNTFDQEVAANNALIAQLNVALASYGIPAIPLQTQEPPNPPLAAIMQTQPLAPLPLPVPDVPSPQTIPLLDPITPPPLNLNDFLSTYYQPIAQALISSLQLTNLQNKNHIANIDFFIFTLPGTKPTQAPALADPVPDLFLGSTSGQATGGVGLASSSPFFSSPHTNGLLASAISSADQQQFQSQDFIPVLGHFAIFATQLALYGGLLAAALGLRIIGTNAIIVPNAVLAYSLANSIANAQVTAQQVSSGKIQQLVKEKVLQEFGQTFDQNSLNNLADLLTASVNLSLLQSSLLNSAVALGTPGLAPQVLGNVLGTPPSALTQPSPQQEANNPFSLIFLKSLLSNQLTESNAVNDNAQAQQVVNNAVNNIQAQNSLNTTSFNNAFVQQLTAAGIAASVAQNLGKLGTDILEQQAKAQAILNADLLDRVKSQNILADQLTYQAQLDSSTAQNVARKALEEAFSQYLISNTAQFQLAVQNRLTSAGINPTAANQAVANTISRLNVQNPNLPPLFNPASPQLLSQNDLSNAIYSHFQSQLKGIVSDEQARELANSGVAALVGQNQPGQTPSILSLLDENAKTLQRIGGNYGDNVVQQSFRDVSSPNIDLLTFSNNLNNLAYSLFFSAHTGLMYSGKPLPSNFKRELDIQV